MDCGGPLAYSTSDYPSTLTNPYNSPASHFVEEISLQSATHDGSTRVLASLQPSHLSGCYQASSGYCEQDASPCLLSTSCSFSVATQQTAAASVYPIDLASTTPQNAAELDFLPVSDQAAIGYPYAEQQQQVSQQGFASVSKNAYGGDQPAAAYASTGVTDSYCLASFQPAQQQTHACCHNLQQVQRQQACGVFVCPLVTYSLAYRTPSCQQQPCCSLYHSLPHAAAGLPAELQYQQQQCGHAPCVFVYSPSLPQPCYASCCSPSVQQHQCVACVQQQPQQFSCVPEGSCFGTALATRQVLCMQQQQQQLVQQQPLLQEPPQQLVYQRTPSDDSSVSPSLNHYMGDGSFNEGSACIYSNSSVSLCSGHFGAASPSASPVGVLPASTEPELQQTLEESRPSLIQASFSLAGDGLQPLGDTEKKIVTEKKKQVLTPIVGVGGLLCLPRKTKRAVSASGVQWHPGFRQLLGKEGRAELIKRMRIVHRNHPVFCDRTLQDLGFSFRRLPHATVEELWQIAYQWGLFEYALRVARKSANWVHHERSRKPTKKQMVKTDESEEVARDETKQIIQGAQTAVELQDISSSETVVDGALESA